MYNDFTPLPIMFSTDFSPSMGGLSFRIISFVSCLSMLALMVIFKDFFDSMY